MRNESSGYNSVDFPATLWFVVSTEYYSPFRPWSCVGYGSNMDAKGNQSTGNHCAVEKWNNIHGTAIVNRKNFFLLTWYTLTCAYAFFSCSPRGIKTHTITMEVTGLKCEN